MTNNLTTGKNNENPDDLYTLNQDFSTLDLITLLRHSAETPDETAPGYFDLVAEHAEPGFLFFLPNSAADGFPGVSLRSEAGTLILSCRCHGVSGRMCSHQTRALYNVISREALRLYFDTPLRHRLIRTAAAAYGLENETDPDAFFRLEHTGGKTLIVPVMDALLPLNPENTMRLKQELLPGPPPVPPVPEGLQGRQQLLLLKTHRYYSHFQPELLESTLNASGKPKNPLIGLDAANLLWSVQDPELLKFYMAVSHFRQQYEPEPSAADLAALKALMANPMNLPVYYQDTQKGTRLNAAELTPVSLSKQPVSVRLTVSLRQHYYTLSAALELPHKVIDLDRVLLKFSYFILDDGMLYLAGSQGLLKLISFFRQKHNRVVIYEGKFPEFEQEILLPLEHHVRIDYTYLREATPEQLQQSGADQTARLIYLSEAADYIWLTPVMKYGAAEVPVLSRKQLRSKDATGKEFTINRRHEEELRLNELLTRQLPYIAEMAGQHAYYVHKKHFLDDSWFLPAFEAWAKDDITVLGFHTLSGNRLNASPARISIEVNSGLNWFETALDIRFGKQKVQLRQLHRAIRNRSRYIKLGDGTLGILPEEWLQKLRRYFSAGEVSGEVIRSPKINFMEIHELYAAHLGSGAAAAEIEMYRQRLQDYPSSAEIPVPQGLQTQLSPYQQEGLNWFGFLNTYGFGGCLADEMGLGKTVQVIAFLLFLRSAQNQAAQLVVMPATLIFNWQQELARFAPELKVYTQYGTSRAKDSSRFGEYDVVLTAYSTLLYDISWMKNYRFHYVFLDEAQLIKNAAGLRYRAVCLLQSFNRIVLTGTPVENNTFDLYSLFSFACPGLLGSRSHFRDHFAIPIDKFQVTGRAAALRKKISPFLLRRTKSSVAAALPEKTEIILYCEMGEAQRAAYTDCRDAYRNYLLGDRGESTDPHTLHMLKGLTLLRQICDSPALLREEALLTDRSAKITVLMEEIRLRSPDHKILVFSQFTGMLDLIGTALKKAGIAYACLTGKTRNREKEVSGFEQDPSIRVFLISLKAGGTGLNLTSADYVYLVDPWWNPAVENQAIDRCHRIGQKNKVTAVRLITPDTIEEKIMQLQQTKNTLVSDLVRAEGSFFRSLSRNELLSLFS